MATSKILLDRVYNEDQRIRIWNSAFREVTERTSGGGDNPYPIYKSHHNQLEQDSEISYQKCSHHLRTQGSGRDK